MIFLKIIIFIFSLSVLFSCGNKNEDKKVIAEIVPENNKSRNIAREMEMVYSLEYYKKKITKYESAYYGFNNSSMEITDLMNISSIIKVERTDSGLLTFLVCGLNQKGYVYWLYGFNDEQKIIEHGFKVLEIVDENPLALQWINYNWKEETGKYIKE